MAWSSNYRCGFAMHCLKHSLLHAVTTCMLALALSACTSANSDHEPAKETMRFDLDIVAARDTNPDAQGRAAPIVVRVYELKTDDVFNSADYSSLQKKDKTLIADSIVVRDEFQLRPGEHKAIRRKVDPATKVLGVLAAYRDLPNSVWRAVYELPSRPDAAWYRRTPKVNLTIDLGANGVKVTERK